MLLGDSRDFLACAGWWGLLSTLKDPEGGGKREAKRAKTVILLHRLAPGKVTYASAKRVRRHLRFAASGRVSQFGSDNLRDA